MIRNQNAMALESDSELALECIAAGIRVAHPWSVVKERLTLEGTALIVGGDRYDLEAYDRILVAGGGNAAGAGAVALESILGENVDGGVVVTDATAKTEHIDVLPGDHPIPSKRAVESTRRMLKLVEGAGPDDLVLAIVGGGGSALMPAPAGGINVEDLKATTQVLLASGASIDEINAVRKHCSDIKGGKLAAAATPATVLGLVFSDVVGDHLDVIASGPLAPDPSSYDDALDVLDHYDLDVPDAIRGHLCCGADGVLSETPDENDSIFEGVHHYVLANSMTAIQAAADTAREHGYSPLILGDRIRGEAREVATVIAGIAEACVKDGLPIEPPAILISGGETTVTLHGDGEGGPNQEFALATAITLEVPGMTVVSVDTDGIDGASDAAGGIVTSDRALPEHAAREALANNDAGGFLADHDGLVFTGPTGTNVNDLRVVAIPDHGSHQ